MRGRIKWFDAGKGFGWVVTDAGEEVYFSAGCLAAGAEVPGAGEPVELDLLEGPAGKIAVRVRPASPAAPRRSRGR